VEHGFAIHEGNVSLQTLPERHSIDETPSIVKPVLHSNENIRGASEVLVVLALASAENTGQALEKQVGGEEVHVESV
jgi:hypothetical protein